MLLAVVIMLNYELNVLLDADSRYSGYTEKQLTPLMKRLSQLILHASKGKFTAVKTKYHDSKFMKIRDILQKKTVEPELKLRVFVFDRKPKLLHYSRERQ